MLVNEPTTIRRLTTKQDTIYTCQNSIVADISSGDFILETVIVTCIDICTAIYIYIKPLRVNCLSGRISPKGCCAVPRPLWIPFFFGYAPSIHPVVDLVHGTTTSMNKTLAWGRVTVSTPETGTSQALSSMPARSVYQHVKCFDHETTSGSQLICLHTRKT